MAFRSEHQVTTERQQPDHLVELRNSGGLAAWRWACVRGAGFPAQLVLSLSAPQLASAIDDLFAAERALGKEVELARTLLQLELERAPPAERKAIKNALRRLANGRMEELSFSAGVAALKATLAANEDCNHRRTQAQAAYQASTRTVGDELRKICLDSNFREALVWQNPTALRTGIASLLRHAAGAADGRTRRNESLAASYLQRYCTKNDTIGFFGPVGWGIASSGPLGVSARPEAGLVEARTVYFEHWAIDALAQELSLNRQLQPWMAPRRVPTIHLQGNLLRYPIGRVAELPDDFAAVLGACDGERTARQIAAELLARPELSLSGEEDVFGVLEELVEKGFASWAFEVPTIVPFPECELRRRLEGIEDPQLRLAALTALNALEAARSNVAAAAGNPQALEPAIEALEKTFAAHTASAPTRRSGGTYASRTVAFEDCRRALNLEVGGALLDRLGPPLGLLIRSARWYMRAVSDSYRTLFSEIYARLRAECGAAEVDFLRFFEVASEHFARGEKGTNPQAGPGGGAPARVALIDSQLQERWGKLLPYPRGARRVGFQAEALSPMVEEAFPGESLGWPRARVHSPDLMVWAESDAALERGELEAVLGEMHLGVNTLLAPPFLNQHPTPDELLRARELDLPGVGIAPMWPKSAGGLRVEISSLSRHDLHLEMGPTRSWRPRDQVVAAGELIVEERAGSLAVRTRDGRHSFDPVVFFEQFLNTSKSQFSLLPRAPHSPRINIDHLVVARETWRFEPTALAFAALEEPYQRFEAARRWAQAAGLPRFLFAKIPEEVKPFYLDLDSPLIVENFLKLARQATALTVTEMLPTLEQAWLRDSEGRRYTSELRLAIVEPRSWSPPPCAGP